MGNSGAGSLIFTDAIFHDDAAGWIRGCTETFCLRSNTFSLKICVISYFCVVAHIKMYMALNNSWNSHIHCLILNPNVFCMQQKQMSLFVSMLSKGTVNVFTQGLVFDFVFNHLHPQLWPAMPQVSLAVPCIFTAIQRLARPRSADSTFPHIHGVHQHQVSPTHVHSVLL